MQQIRMLPALLTRCQLRAYAVSTYLINNVLDKELGVQALQPDEQLSLGTNNWGGRGKMASKRGQCNASFCKELMWLISLFKLEPGKKSTTGVSSYSHKIWTSNWHICKSTTHPYQVCLLARPVLSRAHHSYSDPWCRVAHSSLHHVPGRAPLSIKGDVSPMGSASVRSPLLGRSSLSLSCCPSSSAATWTAGVVHGSQQHCSGGSRH